MSKYEPLNQFLGRLQADYWRPTFLELERILDTKLPAAARKNAGWWEKDASASRHAHAWVDAGWKVEGVDFEKERVTFVRSGAAPTEAQPAQQAFNREELMERLKSRARAFGERAQAGRERALTTVQERPLAAAGISAGVAFAAGIGFGYLLYRALAAPTAAVAAEAEDRARTALATLTEGAMDLADTVGERLKRLRG